MICPPGADRGSKLVVKIIGCAGCRNPKRHEDSSSRTTLPSALAVAGRGRSSGARHAGWPQTGAAAVAGEGGKAPTGAVDGAAGAPLKVESVPRARKLPAAASLRHALTTPARHPDIHPARV